MFIDVLKEVKVRQRKGNGITSSADCPIAFVKPKWWT